MLLFQAKCRTLHVGDLLCIYRAPSCARTCSIHSTQILTISILSYLRRNMSWISSKSNMISLIHSVLAIKISRSYQAQMVLSPSLHALVYQLCILFIKGGTPSIKESGRNGLPYSNFSGHSSKSAMSSTPT